MSLGVFALFFFVSLLYLRTSYTINPSLSPQVVPSIPDSQLKLPPYYCNPPSNPPADCPEDKKGDWKSCRDKAKRNLDKQKDMCSWTSDNADRICKDRSAKGEIGYDACRKEMGIPRGFYAECTRTAENNCKNDMAACNGLCKPGNGQ